METIKLKLDEPIPKNYTGIVESPDGEKYWYKEGKLHREDGPALECKELKVWYNKGIPHRTDGPAYIDIDGIKFWYKEGSLHREDGPAVEIPSEVSIRYNPKNLGPYRAWFIKGVKHREDGPAIELPNGTNEWWYEGKEFSSKDFIEKIKNQ